jgi:hypothetical protein
MRHIDLVYQDPSAAHEKALSLQLQGAYRILISPDRGGYRLTAFLDKSC